MKKLFILIIIMNFIVSGASFALNINYKGDIGVIKCNSCVSEELNSAKCTCKNCDCAKTGRAGKCSRKCKCACCKKAIN